MLPDGPPQFLKCNLNEIVNRPKLITKMVTAIKYSYRALRIEQHYIKPYSKL
jgi:hypothetical protein